MAILKIGTKLLKIGSKLLTIGSGRTVNIFEEPGWSNLSIPSGHPKLWNVRNPEALPGESLIVDLYTWNGCYVELVDMTGDDPDAREPRLWPGSLQSGATFDRTVTLTVPTPNQGLYPALHIMINDDALS